MKQLYIVDYWVPFPAAEGGLVGVVAETDYQCHDLLLEWREDYLEPYDGLIMEKVETARIYDLKDENHEVGVFESFVV
jgi:hypothetical protein